MKNAGNKRPILILLALAILLFGGMALGSTFASQVDKESTPQKFLPAESDDYKVFVKYHDGKNYDGGRYSNVLGPETPVFTRDIIWCPGYTKIVYLELSSEEAFPVECTLTMTAEDGLLNDVLDYTLLGALKPNDVNHPRSWKEVATPKLPLTTEPITIIDAVTLDGSAPQYYAIAIHMDETAGNQYRDQTLNINFQLVINANYKPGETPVSSAQF